MGGTIVCGVSASASGRAPAGLASALGTRLGLRLVLVSVVDGVATGTTRGPTARTRQNGAEAVLREVAGAIGTDPETRIVHGRPAQALARVAAEEGADLIVVGSRPAGLGRGKLHSTLARELEAMTHVPVLVTPPATRRRSGQRLAMPAVTD